MGYKQREEQKKPNRILDSTLERPRKETKKTADEEIPQCKVILSDETHTESCGRMHICTKRCIDLKVQAKHSWVQAMSESMEKLKKRNKRSIEGGAQKQFGSGQAPRGQDNAQLELSKKKDHSATQSLSRNPRPL